MQSPVLEKSPQERRVEAGSFRQIPSAPDSSLVQKSILSSTYTSGSFPQEQQLPFLPSAVKLAPPTQISGKGILGRLGQEGKQALHPQIKSIPLHLRLPGNAIRTWVGYKDGSCNVKTSLQIPSNLVTPDKATLISTLSEVRWKTETEIQGQPSFLYEAAETVPQVR